MRPDWCWIFFRPCRMTQGPGKVVVMGLAVTGANIARDRASREGNTIAACNRSPGRTHTLIDQHPEAGFMASESIDDFAATLAKPPTAIVMVQVGQGTGALAERFAERFERAPLRVDARRERARATPAGAPMAGCAMATGSALTGRMPQERHPETAAAAGRQRL